MRPKVLAFDNGCNGGNNFLRQNPGLVLAETIHNSLYKLTLGMFMLFTDLPIYLVSLAFCTHKYNTLNYENFYICHSKLVLENIC